MSGVKLEGFSDFETTGKTYKKRLDREISKALNRAADDLIKMTKSKTPVDTGLLRRSWYRSEVRNARNVYSIDVYNATHYAKFIEWGHWVNSTYTVGIGWYYPGRYMLGSSLILMEKDFENRLIGCMEGAWY